MIERTAGAADPILGMFQDEPSLMDDVVETGMQARERHALRQPGE